MTIAKRNPRSSNPARSGDALGIEVSRRVDIKSIQLVESSVKLDPSAGAPPYQVEVNRKSSWKPDDKNSQLLVITSFRVQTESSTNRGSAKPYLAIAVSYLLTYGIADFEGIEPAQVESFAETNAVFNAWPYLREYVQSTTLRMGLPPLTVPLLKLDSGGRLRGVDSVPVSRKTGKRTR